MTTTDRIWLMVGSETAKRDKTTPAVVGLIIFETHSRTLLGGLRPLYEVSRLEQRCRHLTAVQSCGIASRLNLT